MESQNRAIWRHFCHSVLVQKSSDQAAVREIQVRSVLQTCEKCLRAQRNFRPSFPTFRLEVWTRKSVFFLLRQVFKMQALVFSKVGFSQLFNLFNCILILKGKRKKACINWSLQVWRIHRIEPKILQNLRQKLLCLLPAKICEFNVHSAGYCTN